MYGLLLGNGTSFKFPTTLPTMTADLIIILVFHSESNLPLLDKLVFVDALRHKFDQNWSKLLILSGSRFRSSHLRDKFDQNQSKLPILSGFRFRSSLFRHKFDQNR